MPKIFERNVPIDPVQSIQKLADLYQQSSGALLGVLTTRRGDQQVAIKAVSGRHVRLSAPLKPKAGEAVILNISGFFRGGRILWVDQAECAVTFSEDLSLLDARRHQRMERR